MTPSRTWRSANGSIIPCSRDIFVILRSDLIDMGAQCNGANLTYATPPIVSIQHLVNFYESGMPPLGSAHERFSVKFYLVAVLFILFDIETVFLIPWAVIFMGTSTVSTGFLLIEMLVFMLVLFVGYVYVWKRGAFQWD